MWVEASAGQWLHRWWSHRDRPPRPLDGQTDRRDRKHYLRWRPVTIMIIFLFLFDQNLTLQQVPDSTEYNIQS